MQSSEVQLELTREELQLVLRIVQSAQLTGTAESLRVALALHSSILAKTAAAIEELGRRQAQAKR